MNRKTFAVALVALALAPFAMAQDRARSTLSGGDKRFMQHAAVGGLAEVEMGRLAQEKAISAEAKQFADRMVADHAKANEDLQRIAGAKGVQLPTELDRSHRKDLEDLRKPMGPDFDRAYMKHMAKDHEKDVKEFRKQLKSTKDPDLRAFLAKTTPILESHLEAAIATRDIVQGSKRYGDRKVGSGKP